MSALPLVPESGGAGCCDPGEPLVDAEAFALLEELAGDDDSFLQELIAVYCAQARELVDEVAAAAAEGSTPRFVRAVHTLCGSSRNVGASSLGQICARMERDANHAEGFSMGEASHVLLQLVPRTCLALSEHRPAPREEA